MNTKPLFSSAGFFSLLAVAVFLGSGDGEMSAQPAELVSPVAVP